MNSGYVYNIVVSDTDPLVGPPANCLTFEEYSYRKAHKRMEDAMRRGYYVSCCREVVRSASWDPVPEDPPAKHTRKKK